MAQRIAIFASGAGSNAENIINYFRHNACGAEVVLVVSNRNDAGVLQRASHLGVPACVVSRADINNPDIILPLMDHYSVDVVVLAGFLLMVPVCLIERFHDRMVNIHPSLLPKFGGKGMYGRYVHEAVVAAGETESGITIHMVSERYDEGRILYQGRVPVEPGDTPDEVESRVRALELEHYPRVIQQVFCTTE
ncbi:MAG: phosphoribosylglycinamide formyltransferase [Muribaculaceae bacterium]|nr:phosphoribosylglycinamide formyltransferase [Muribaculaceae bacterium]